MKIFSAQLKGTTTVVSGSTASITGSFTGSIAGIDINATNAFTASTIARLSSIETISSSNDSRVNSLEAFSSSIFTTNTFTSSTSARLNSIETISASNISRLSSLEAKTGSLATTGSNTFIGTQTITGSLYISSDLIVQGSSSLQNITASAVSIGTNIVNLNTANPAIRYAGLSIGDSGSIGSSGSFLYDSVQDEFIFVHRGDTTTVTSSVVLMGPQTYDSIGNETYLTFNRIPKGAGNEHLVDSNISDDGTTVTLISRALSGTSATFSNNVTAVQGIFRNSGVPAIQAFRDLDVTSVGNAGQGIEFGARNGANYVVGATLYGVLENPATNGALALQTLTAGSLTTKLSIDSTGTAAFSSSVGINGGDFRYRPSGDVTNNPALVFKDAGNSALDICSEVIGDANAASRPIAFRVSSVAGGRYEVMRITSDGRVGMGTTNPQALLHLSSTINSLRIDANAGFEIFITGSDSANIYHATPNQAIYLNTNGGQLHFGTSNASTLLTISGSNVGIGVTNPTATLQVTGPNAVGTFFNAQNDGAGGAVFSRINASSFPFNQYIFNNGNVGINTPSPETKLHVEGSTAIGTTGTENILLLGRAIGAGASFQQAASLKLGRYANAGGSFESYTRLDFALRDNSAASNYNTNTTVMTLTNAGNVGISTTSPNFPLHVYKNSGTSTINVESVSGQNSQYRMEEAGVVKFAITYVPSDATTRMYFAGHGTDLITLKGSKVGISRVSPLATLSVYGGAFQLMGDYANHQTIIKNAATAGTLSGSLTITVPDMAGAGGSIGYGGFSCEVYVAGYNAMYCHAWFSGYTNNGVTPSETAILRSSGGWSVSQFGTGSQGLVFVIDYPASIIHPTARIIINKGGHSYENEYPANSITTVWT